MWQAVVFHVVPDFLSFIGSLVHVSDFYVSGVSGYRWLNMDFP